MIKLLITSFFIYMQKYNKHSMQLKYEKYKTISDKKSEDIYDIKYNRGYDLRFNISIKDDENELVTIKRNFKYKNI